MVKKVCSKNVFNILDLKLEKDFNLSKIIILVTIITFIKVLN